LMELRKGRKRQERPDNNQRAVRFLQRIATALLLYPGLFSAASGTFFFESIDGRYRTESGAV
jgi:hypothetical protein